MDTPQNSPTSCWEDALREWNQLARSAYTRRLNTVAVRGFFAWSGCALQEVAADLLEAYALYLQDRLRPQPNIGATLAIASMNRYTSC